MLFTFLPTKSILTYDGKNIGGVTKTDYIYYLINISRV